MCKHEYKIWRYDPPLSLANKKGTKVIKLTCSVSCISATLSEYVLFSPPNSGRSTVDVLGLEFASGVE